MRERERGRGRRRALEMGFRRRFPFFILLLLLALLQSPAVAERKSYVVYMGAGSFEGEDGVSTLAAEEIAVSHRVFLGSVMESEEMAQRSIFYSYSKVINGFAAMLDEDEVAELSKSRGVKAVVPNRARKLHTTRSWNFLGLEKDGVVPADSIWTKARFGEDSIIGTLDTGVWPESASFDDEGYGPVPPQWKGVCDRGWDQNFSCNRKLIGARYFNKGFAAAVRVLPPNRNSPRDTAGHGTHTLSTAGGNFVEGVSVLGQGNGTAKGGSPRARVAAYKVCWDSTTGGGCYDADILAAFEAAIRDGVDVISASLGSESTDYFVDPIAIGSFHAMKKGITVVCSAGNDGPKLGSVSNVAPWMVTVAASTLDRSFSASAILGSGQRLLGQSLSAEALKGKKLRPLISSAAARAANANATAARLCFLGSLDPVKVKGKIVVCLRGINPRVEKGETVLHAGGAGMILANAVEQSNDISADAHFLPAVHISYTDGLAVYEYINSTRNPTATITPPVTVTNVRPTPVMAAFSSPGPNLITPDILKPDITAPGVNVIAAYSEAVGPSGLAFDKKRIPYATDSGTSMSCPHISGVAGLLKTLYPNWSPAAIKSAIMTTATTDNNLGMPITNSSLAVATPFSYGAGHVRPNLAMDPGLVYDLTAEDYLSFLCAVGYDSRQISIFVNESFSCPRKTPSIADFNYPSITVASLLGEVTVSRKLKNVGTPGIYRARVQPPPGIFVKVEPDMIEFKRVGEVREFKVIMKAARGAGVLKFLFGRLTWRDGYHRVSSPIAVVVQTRVLG
ncbi:subtilisin-like protease SBT5.3 [Wolffia australiana]